MSMGGPSDALSAATLPGTWGGLRPLDCERDAGRLFADTHGAEIGQIWLEMKVGPFPTEADFVRHVAELVADPLRAFFAVVGPDDRAVGWLCLMEASSAHKAIELGYVLYAPSMQRTTLATEAFYLVMSHVFDALGFQRLEWTCTAENAKSRRAADRLGFTFEGILRSKLVLKGYTRDVAIYSLLASEWPDVKRAMRDWLDPSNFDGGVQRLPMATRRGADQRGIADGTPAIRSVGSSESSSHL
jgi:RimJ/RimL family protein N-acetyltransferase